MERLQRETPLRQAGVRDGQARLIHDPVAVEQEVEVDRARAEARALLADPAQHALDGEEAVEQVTRREPRLDRDGAVQKGRLIRVADWLGLTQRRDGDDLDPGFGAQQLDGPADRRLPVAEVGAEADVRPCHRLVRSTVAAVYSTGSAELDLGLADADADARDREALHRGRRRSQPRAPRSG